MKKNKYQELVDKALDDFDKVITEKGTGFILLTLVDDNVTGTFGLKPGNTIEDVVAFFEFCLNYVVDEGQEQIAKMVGDVITEMQEHARNN